ncbi:MAG: hypothetical protein ACLR5O_00330 [Romboutsia timonensis]|uniref:hypothetical protein n=1 Tax=Romboutsia timonensis TaxID=1776391 RepID=UPI00399F453F
MKLINVKEAIEKINKECVNIPNISLREAGKDEEYCILLSVRELDKKTNKLNITSCQKEIKDKDKVFIDHGDIREGLNTKDLSDFTKTSGLYKEENKNKNIFRNQINNNIFIDVMVTNPAMILIRVSLMDKENRPEMELLKSLFINTQDPNEIGSKIFEIINGKLVMDQVVCYEYEDSTDKKVKLLESVFINMLQNECDCEHHHH